VGQDTETEEAGVDGMELQRVIRLLAKRLDEDADAK
jgi:hypothetical protein